MSSCVLWVPMPGVHGPRWDSPLPTDKISSDRPVYLNLNATYRLLGMRCTWPPKSSHYGRRPHSQNVNRGVRSLQFRRGLSKTNRLLLRKPQSDYSPGLAKREGRINMQTRPGTSDIQNARDVADPHVPRRSAFGIDRRFWINQKQTFL